MARKSQGTSVPVIVYPEVPSFDLISARNLVAQVASALNGLIRLARNAESELPLSGHELADLLDPQVERLFAAHDEIDAAAAKSAPKREFPA